MTAKQFILNNEGGVASIGLYENYSTREINKAVRELIDEKKIEITCPKAGFNLDDRDGWNKKGVEISLKTKSYAIYHL